MSIIIYWAFRIPKGRWVEFIDLIHDQMFASAVKHVKEAMKAVKVDNKKCEAGIKKYKIKKARQARYRRHEQFKLAIKECGRAADDPEIDFFDVDCGVNFWMRGKYVYVIPIAPRWIKRDLKFPDWVEDYSYWNNVDPPDNISYRDFEKRKAIWEEVNCGDGRAGHNARRLYYEVVDLTKDGTHVSKWDLLRAIFPDTM
jgi:hypothetical protein